MADFRIKTYTVGQVGTNCYILYREAENHPEKPAVLVDPGDHAGLIVNKCRELGVKPEAVLLTHGHFDHIKAVDEIRRVFPEAPVYVGEKEKAVLADPNVNLSSAFGNGFIVSADRFVKDGDELFLAGIHFQVLLTPGHTCGSVCYYCEDEDVLISGDTLFADSLGRTDFPTGSAASIAKSITGRLFKLPDDTVVYPGHGDPTTIGHEKQYNPVSFYRG